MNKLTESQAQQIAEDCIRQATGFDGQIATESTLSDIGVDDDDARDAVNDDIVTNKDKGVRRFGFELGPDDLTFTTASKFFELRDEISKDATTIHTPTKKKNHSVNDLRERKM
jgi:hypothetical protein